MDPQLEGIGRKTVASAALGKFNPFSPSKNNPPSHRLPGKINKIPSQRKFVAQNKTLQNGTANKKYTRSSTKKTDDSFDRINGNDIQNYIASNKIQEINQSNQITLKQLINVTEQQTLNTETIANLSRQMANFDKLHLSMLELLENVETLENKVDKTFPEFRKEISKVESQATQIGADVSLLKEDHRNIKRSMKAISFSVSTLQDKSRDDQERLQKVEDHLDVLEKSAVLQHSRLHDHILKEESSDGNLNATKSTIHLVEELKSFESEYKSIVNKLPRDCGSVDGVKGIYLISPGDGEPILAHCDHGWTTIQKRYDGNINFNRNWNEYSNGFGSATGEHWLGNRNLHHLRPFPRGGLQPRLQINGFTLSRQRE